MATRDGERIIIFWGALYLCSYILQIVHGYEIIHSPSEGEMTGLPIILWWDGFGERQDYVMSCPNNIQCRVTCDKKSFHKDDIMVYMFYGSSLLDDALPLPRQSGDLWALIHEESPKNSDWIFTFPSTLEIFNYSATFQRDSHYPFPTQWLSGASALTDKTYLASTAEKNRLRKEGLAPILFVHSDCSTPSNREGYIKQLMKHIHVDSYGSCLHNKDFPEGEGTQGSYGFNSYNAPHFLNFTAQYKFSIAFENAICEDYITEKLWRPLSTGSVPIVMGSPKVKDFLPSEKSAILISDFETVQDLAGYIHYLDTHDEEYEAYLKFKDTGITNTILSSELERMSPGPGEFQNFATAAFGFECYLCDKLHTARQAVKSGGEIPKSQVPSNHFDCPLPSMKYNDNGRLVEAKERDRELEFYRLNAKAFREFYDRGEKINSIDLYDYTTKLQRGEKVKRDEL